MDDARDKQGVILPGIEQCPICASTGSVSRLKEVPGYIEGSRFEVFACSHCDTQFSCTNDDLAATYRLIYSSSATPGYSRYHEYAEAITKETDPLRFLALREAAYYPVYEFVRDKRDLTVLEIGCGYGYLSYSLRARGFSVTGADVSEEAVDFARRNFGDFFVNASIEELDERIRTKFDLIIATEVIEHLKNPGALLEKCKKLLSEGGRIVITTPNRDYWRKSALWQTDPPPVHVYWMGKKAIKILAQMHSLQISFTDFSRYYPSTWNRLANFIWARKELLTGPVVTQDGTPCLAGGKSQHETIRRARSFVLHRFLPIRAASNFVFNIFNGSEMTIGAVMRVSENNNSGVRGKSRDANRGEE